MNEKNVVLLGGSNSVIKHGLQMGLRQGIEKLNTTLEAGVKFYNFAVGGCTAIQNLYEVVRHKEILNNSELIITESNVNDIYATSFEFNKLALNKLYSYIFWLYQELYPFQKKYLFYYFLSKDKIIK